MATIFKITLLGDAAVGKTTLRRSFMGDNFKETYQMTIGADFAAYRVSDEKGNDVTLQIFDLAGQIRFSSIVEAYFSGTRGALILFDVTRPETFATVGDWINQLHTNLHQNFVPIVIVGNKSDLKGEVEEFVERETVEEYCQQLSEWSGFNVPYFETSAKLGENVDEAFMKLIAEISNHLGIYTGH